MTTRLKIGGTTVTIATLLVFHRLAGSSAYFKAELFARLGQNDRAVESLNEAYKTHNHLMTQLKVNPAFDGLRSDPRFVLMLHQMNLAN